MSYEGISMRCGSGVGLLAFILLRYLVIIQSQAVAGKAAAAAALANSVELIERLVRY